MCQTVPRGLPFDLALAVAAPSQRLSCHRVINLQDNKGQRAEEVISHEGSERPYPRFVGVAVVSRPTLAVGVHKQADPDLEDGPVYGSTEHYHPMDELSREAL